LGQQLEIETLLSHPQVEVDDRRKRRLEGRYENPADRSRDRLH
jgi:hypothetical protein